MTEEKKKSLHVISGVLCEAYNLLVEAGQVNFQLHDENIHKIDSIVKTVYAEYFGHVRYPTDHDRAAAFFCLIIKDHPVTDGNKRLATLWLRLYCVTNKIEIDKRIAVDILAVSVEKEKRLSNEHLVPLVKEILFPEKLEKSSLYNN